LKKILVKGIFVLIPRLALANCKHTTFLNLLLKITFWSNVVSVKWLFGQMTNLVKWFSVKRFSVKWPKPLYVLRLICTDTYLLTYLLTWYYNLYLVKVCWRRSFHDCLSWAQCVQSPLKYEQLVLLPFGQHPRLTAIDQDWADQGLVNGVKRSSNVIQALVKFRRVLNTPMSLNLE
jgi:hypothetical protein